MPEGFATSVPSSCSGPRAPGRRWSSSCSSPAARSTDCPGRATMSGGPSTIRGGRAGAPTPSERAAFGRASDASSTPTSTLTSGRAAWSRRLRRTRSVFPYLLELFPDAIFVAVSRNPCEVIASLINGWRDPSGRFRTYYVPERLRIPGHRAATNVVLFPDRWLAQLCNAIGPGDRLCSVGSAERSPAGRIEHGGPQSMGRGPLRGSSRTPRTRSLWDLRQPRNRARVGHGNQARGARKAACERSLRTEEKPASCPRSGGTGASPPNLKAGAR